MLDLRNPPPPAWPDHLVRIGEGEHWPEPFEGWWARHRHRLGHLAPEIAEQWIFRHFPYTWFKFLPLETLTWRRENWSTDDLLAKVHLERDELAPEDDYRAFNAAGMITATDFNTNGTWSMPPIILKTPNGIVSFDHGPLPAVRWTLVEGHKRFRYLAGARAFDRAGGPHDVFVIFSPIS